MTFSIPQNNNQPVPVESAMLPRSRYISVSNQKGGVGKTTTTVNLATALAAVGKKVMVIDLDPQGNASTGLGIDRADRVNGTYEVLFGEATIDEAATPTKVPNLFVVPSSIHLSGAEIELVDAKNRETRLKSALAASHEYYDYILFDCPPSLNLLTLNALVASDGVLVPLQCEFFALEGLSHLVNTIERVRTSFNEKLELQGIVLTMYDKRNNLSNQVADNVRSFFGDKVYETVIPRNVRISEAPSFGLPAIVYDMNCIGSQAYIQLAKEVLKREKNIADKNQSATGEVA
jgi:chromosome partitioning protein